MRKLLCLLLLLYIPNIAQATPSQAFPLKEKALELSLLDTPEKKNQALRSGNTFSLSKASKKNDDPSKYGAFGLRDTVVPYWLRDRFWWSLELGAAYHTYSPAPEDYHILGLLLGARCGYALGRWILAGDLYLIGSTQDYLLLQFGAMLGYTIRKNWIIEAGMSFDVMDGQEILTKSGILMPVKVGLIYRLLFNRMALSFHYSASFAFGSVKGGWHISFQNFLAIAIGGI